MKSIFFDPTGRRRRYFFLALLTLGLEAAGLFHLLAQSVIYSKNHPPPAPPVEFRPLPGSSSAPSPGDFSRPLPAAKSGGLVGAYLAPWQENSLTSLRGHVDSLSMLMGVWLHLDEAGREAQCGDFLPHGQEVVDLCAAHGVKVVAVLNNASGSVFDGARVHRLLDNVDWQERLAASQVKFLLAHHLAGLQLDLENLQPADLERLPDFLTRLSLSLHRHGLILQTAAEVSALQCPVDWRRWVTAVDGLILMDYDQHSSEDEPGPVASLGWSIDNLRRAIQVIPPQKLILGLGNYGYDWTDGRPGALSLGYLECLSRAAGRPDAVTFDGSSSLSYRDQSQALHQVHFLDAVSAGNLWNWAQPLGLQGAALWVLGSEDPSLWTFYDRGHLDRPVDFSALEKIDPPLEIETSGLGDVLQVVQEPSPGWRSLTLDQAGQRVVGQVYHHLPCGYRIRRYGYRPRTVALTFDDGPDTVFTPQVLDVLKKHGVRATFFALGANAHGNPELLARIQAEGHELGNHSFTHPNLSQVSPTRFKLELNVTEHIFQAITGRSSQLFRPPYNALSQPTTLAEVIPLAEAGHLGFLCVGEVLDPEDWLRTDPQAIFEAAVAEVHSGAGNCLLLHDGGGDRSATVAALDKLIPALRKEGYHFVTASDLAGRGPSGAALGWLEGVTLLSLGRVQKALGLAFQVAIAAAALRLVMLTWLAWSPPPAPKGARPTAVALIAAYNEAKVIGATVERLLESDYPDLRVVVVDDGSQDGTAGAVPKDPRVLCLCQDNSGKSAALNQALGVVGEAEIVICLDADTHIERSAISLLADHFTDPRVGAVAGNVKVGNRNNLLTLWQSIEYIISQNLDRRAYARLNAIPVVPGALGAWRRSALEAVGGYQSDTLAEDMDLTLRLQRAGFRVADEPRALAYTEAPQTLGAFFRQRLRWTYGSLQCLWKHRGALGGCGWLGGLVLPSLWTYQIFLQLLSPLVDLQLLWAVCHGFRFAGAAPLALGFLLLEGLAGWLAFRRDGESPVPLLLIVTQRLVYRQILYWVVLQSLARAIQGLLGGWNKLERKGTVKS